MDTDRDGNKLASSIYLFVISKGYLLLTQRNRCWTEVASSKYLATSLATRPTVARQAKGYDESR